MPIWDIPDIDEFYDEEGNELPEDPDDIIEDEEDSNNWDEEDDLEEIEYFRNHSYRPD